MDFSPGRKRKLLSQPRMPIAQALHAEASKLVGRVRLLGDALRSPIRGLSCAGYTLTTDVRPTPLCRIADLEIVDESGRAHVLGEPELWPPMSTQYLEHGRSEWLLSDGDEVAAYGLIRRHDGGGGIYRAELMVTLHGSAEVPLLIWCDPELRAV